MINILTTAIERCVNAQHTTIFFKEYEKDSPDALNHFHVHLVARKPNDFDNPDDIYKYL